MVAAVKKKKPVKKKGRRTKIETPIPNAEPDVKMVKTQGALRSTVSAGEIRSVIQDTMWRVLTEITPDLENASGGKMNSDESAYVMSLDLMLGWSGQNPRRGQKIREHEYTSKETPLCRECR